MTTFRERMNRLADLETQAETRAVRNAARCPICRRTPPPAQFFAELAYIYGDGPEVACIWCAIETAYVEETNDHE